MQVARREEISERKTPADYSVPYIQPAGVSIQTAIHRGSQNMMCLISQRYTQMMKDDSIFNLMENM